MVGIVLASHGEFCNGLRESVEMLAGTIEQCETCSYQLGVFPDAYDEKLSEAIDKVNNIVDDVEEGVLVFVDLKGGTPYNRAIMQARDKKVYVVYGANVPSLLTTVLSRFDDTTVEELAKIAEEAAKGSDSVGCINFQ